jgi:hypothetical protein
LRVPAVGGLDGSTTRQCPKRASWAPGGWSQRRMRPNTRNSLWMHGDERVCRSARTGRLLVPPVTPTRTDTSRRVSRPANDEMCRLSLHPNRSCESAPACGHMYVPHAGGSSARRRPPTPPREPGDVYNDRRACCPHRRSLGGERPVAIPIIADPVHRRPELWPVPKSESQSVGGRETL